MSSNSSYLFKHITAEISNAAFGPHQSIYSIIEKEIFLATKSIDVCMFLFVNKTIADLLIKVSKQGIKLRILVDIRSDIKMQDKNGHKLNLSVLEHLSNNNIEYKVHDSRLKDTGILHHKFLIIDSRIVMLGSYNFQYEAEYRNHESFLVFRSSDLSRLYEDQFNSIYERSFNANSLSDKYKHARPFIKKRTILRILLLLSISLNIYLLLN